MPVVRTKVLPRDSTASQRLNLHDHPSGALAPTAKDLPDHPLHAAEGVGQGDLSRPGVLHPSFKFVHTDILARLVTNVNG